MNQLPGCIDIWHESSCGQRISLF